LRVVAAANAANANINSTSSTGPVSAGKGSVRNNSTRPSVTSARKAGEEARKALLRQ
jgi:NIMA (never in mitosis gene a)-related kinase